MAKGIGRLVQVGFKPESSRGTAQSSASYYNPWSTVSFEDKVDKVMNEQSYGVVEDTQGSSNVKQFAEVEWSAPITDITFPYLLYAVLGTKSVATHSGESVVYDHTITKSQSAQLPSYTLFLDDPVGGQDRKNALAVCSKLDINYELGGFATFTAGWRAQVGANATLSPSTVTQNRFLQKHLTFKLASSYSGLDAASAISLKNLSLSFNPNLEDDDVLGDDDPADFLSKQFSIEGQVELLWTATTYKDAYLANTNYAMRIDMVNTDVTIGSASNPQVRIDLAKVTLTDVSRAIELDGLVRQTLSFKAHYSATDSLMVSCLCVNTVATLT